MDVPFGGLHVTRMVILVASVVQATVISPCTPKAISPASVGAAVASARSASSAARAISYRRRGERGGEEFKVGR